MPSLVTIGPGNFTGVDLSANAFWRVTLGSSSGGQGGPIFLALILIYPPVPGQHPDYSRIVLSKAQVPFANTTEEVNRVAMTALSSGVQEIDRQRMTEAYNLFRNNGRIKDESMATAMNEGQELLSTYWEMREWAEKGCKDEFIREVCGYKIIGRP